MYPWIQATTDQNYLGEQNLYIYIKYLQWFSAIVLKQCSIVYISSSIELLAINNQPVTYEEVFLFYMQTRHHFAFETQTSTVFSFCRILKSMCTSEKNYTYPERKQRCPESSGRERESWDLWVQSCCATTNHSPPLKNNNNNNNNNNNKTVRK